MTDVTEVKYYVALFDSVTRVMKAEKILRSLSVPHKIIPVPKAISSDCGVGIRFEQELIDDITAALSGQADAREYRPL